MRDRGSGGWLSKASGRAWLAGSVALVSTALAAVTVLAIEGQRPSRAVPEGDLSARVAVIKTSMAAAPTATLKDNSLVPRAWLFDIAAGTVTELAPGLTRVQFLDDMALIARRDGKEVLTDLAGNGQRTIGPLDSGPCIGAWAFPERGDGRVLVWQPGTGELGRFDAASGQQVSAVRLPALAASGECGTAAWAVSDDGGRLAFAMATTARTSVQVQDTRGGAPRTVFATSQDEVQGLEWSPDASLLFVATRTRDLVVDLGGRVVWEQPVDATYVIQWAGNGRLLVSEHEPAPNVAPGHPAPQSFFVDLPARTETPAVSADQPVCISPDGRSGVYTVSQSSGTTTASQSVVRDLRTDEVLLEAETNNWSAGCSFSSAGSWSPDGSKVVLSSWGN